MISLKTHDVLDYVIGALLVVAPALFGFLHVSRATNTMMILGFVLLAYSLFTDYYYSVARAIPLNVHMVLDVMIGLAVIVGPQVFGYRSDLTDAQYALHLILGVGTIGMVAVTRFRTSIFSGTTTTPSGLKP